jgi:hypothetical protein
LKEAAIMVTDSPGQQAWLREIEAYAELAIEALHAPTVEEDLEESRQMLCAVRDVLTDLRDIPGADGAVAEGYRTVRARAAAAIGDSANWSDRCPWTIDTLIAAASRQIEAWGGGSSARSRNFAAAKRAAAAA